MRSGFYWARSKDPEYDRWIVVEVRFLSDYIFGSYIEVWLTGFDGAMSPSDWIFGPRIEPPNYDCTAEGAD